MKKALILAALLFAGTAQATGLNLGDTTNNYLQPGAHATGGDATSIAGAASIAEAKANASAIAAQQQGQAQGQQMAQGIAGSGNSGGNDIRTSTNVTVEGNQRSAPAVYAGNVPVVAKSCRLYLFGGASGTGGAGSGTFPIGNDQTCLSGALLDMMERTGGFTQNEKQTVVCKAEGMADLPTCKSLSNTR